MYKVIYKLFGEIYEIILPDYASAYAFACDFIEFQIVKI